MTMSNDRGTSLASGPEFAIGSLLQFTGLTNQAALNGQSGVIKVYHSDN
jgi:hypothetical protein